jgi:two-component system phosphate regulon sensor histidine kinase PhoR
VCWRSSAASSAARARASGQRGWPSSRNRPISHDRSATGPSSAAVSPDRIRDVRRKTALADAALVALVALLTAVAVFAAARLYTTADNRYIKEAFPIRFYANDMVVQMLNQETGIRGYLITGNGKSLEPYRTGRSGVSRDLAALRRLSGRRPEIAPDVDSSADLVNRIEQFYEQQIALVERGGAGQRRAQRNVLAGTRLFDRFRASSGRLTSSADEIIAAARKSQRRTFWSTLALALVAGVAAAGIAFWLLLSVPRRIWSLYDVERDLRETAERGARASRSLEHVDDAVILLDGEGMVRYWNPGASAHLGPAEADALDRPLVDVVPEASLIEQTLAREGSDAVLPVARDGVERWLVVRETRFPEGRVLVLQDVTGERELERTRSDFLATASHELRTPLAAVYGAVRTLRREDRPSDPDLDRQLLEMIETEAHRLAEIVDQILVSTEVDRGSVPLQSEECDIRELCESAVESARVRAPAGIELALDVPDGLVVQTDAARLRQVVVNLLDNAVKYSPSGGRVDVRAAERDGSFAIEVADEGLGIPDEAQQRIFEKFVRLDPEMRRGVGGSGLGLYISQELVERMGGRLRVHSEPGRGSTFTILLPR